jgi:5-methylcytosine-specific restriction endonuclease McrA
MVVKRRRTNLSNEKARLKYFLWILIQKYQPICPMCGEKFKYDEVLPARGTDNLTDHHIDGDHSNMDLANRILVHRHCHKRYHVKDNIHKEQE